MRAAISKFVGLMIFISAACAFADTKLPKCVIFTFGHCQGSLKYPNRDIYTGEFNYGQPNGAGKMTYANGDVYAGSFFEGQKHGIGDYTWADGNRYIGQFIEGNLQGRGAYYFLANNKVNPDKYIGDFKKNAFNGDGVYTYGNGAVVSGKFKDGRKVDDLPAVVVAEAQIKTELNSGVNQTNKYQEKNAQDVTVTAIKSNISKGKEILALADVSRLTEEKPSLATQLDSQAELDRSLRRKLEIEPADAVIAQEMAQSIADENARLKSQIETQIELDRTLRLKLEVASADAVIANEMARSIADENANLKRQIDSQVELDKSQKLKMETESVAALIAQEKAQSIADENARLKSKIETQAELDRNLRLKLEAESAVALIAKEKAQSIADENARLKSQIEVELEMERSLRMKMEGVQTSVKNNDSEEIIKNTLSTSDVFPLMTTFEKGKFFISGSMNSTNIRFLSILGNNPSGDDSLNMPVVNSPFSLGIGYNVNENYGFELGFKYYGHHFDDIKSSSLIQNDSFKSSAWLFGGFLDIPMSSAVGINIKAGIQNTDTTLVGTRERTSISPTGQTIYSSGQFNVSKYSTKAWDWYYGVGLSYFIDKDNSVYLNWIRAKSSLVLRENPHISIDLNTDVTEFGFKHSF